MNQEGQEVRIIEMIAFDSPEARERPLRIQPRRVPSVDATFAGHVHFPRPEELRVEGRRLCAVRKKGLAESRLASAGKAPAAEAGGASPIDLLSHGFLISIVLRFAVSSITQEVPVFCRSHSNRSHANRNCSSRRRG